MSLWYICAMKKIITIGVLSFFFTCKLFAQEVQIPFDSSGKIEVITSEMEHHLQLFPNYPRFFEARLLKQSDSAYILEISSLLEDGKLTRNREQQTPQDVLALQRKFSAAAYERSPSILLDQSSRSKFLIWQTSLSVFVYAPLFISSLSSPDAGAGTGITLVVGGLGYLVPYVLTKNAPMTDGQSSLALGGSFLGLGHGALLDLLATNGNPGKEIFAISALTAIAETGIGYYVARKNNMSEGTADIIRYGGLFGAMQGAGLATVINSTDPSGSYIAGLTLIGSAGGFYAGTLLTNNHRYSRGSASVVLTAGIFGPYISGLLYLSFLGNTNFNSLSRSGLALSAMAGNIGGILLAHTLMRGKHYSTSEGNDVILGTSAGWLIGTGVAYIALYKNNNFESTWAFSIPSIIGTAAGFAIMINTIGKGSGDDISSGWKMNVNPGALMGSLLPQHSNSTNAYIPPAVTVQYRW